VADGGAVRATGRRVLWVLGDRLGAPVGQPNGPHEVPRAGDTVRVPGDPEVYSLTAVVAGAAPGGGLAPYYECEVAR
jgi:hypothetical protein